MADHQTHPTRREILRRIIRDYEMLNRFWREGYFERGLGTVVLYQIHTSVGDLRSVSEYWTLAEVRAYLRGRGHLDEFMYAWLLSIRNLDAFPALVIGAPHVMGGMRLSFYRIQRPIVEKSGKSG